MCELRRREPERLVKQNLPRRVRQVIFPSNHVRDFHQRIVHDDGEVVGGRTVRPEKDGIADDVDGKPHLAAHQIGERQALPIGYSEANGGTLAGRQPPGCLIARQLTTGPCILHGATFRQRRLAICFELLGRAEAVVRRARVQEFLSVRLDTGAAARTAGRGRGGRRCPGPRPSSSPTIGDRRSSRPPTPGWSARRRCPRSAG